MKKTLPKFVALFDQTIDAPAWRALTPSARMLYVALKRKLNYEKNNNGKIYLAHRSAARELGSNKNGVTRWYSELRFYGFIVMTDPGGLGVDGKGRAAKWRLTEWECDGKPATRDFLKWNGRKFKSLYPKGGHPVPKRWTKGNGKVSPKGGQRACTQKGDITIGKPYGASLVVSLDDRRPKNSRARR